WTVVRKTDNFQTRNPIQNVTSPNFTCYNGNGGSATAPSTYTIAAGANVTFQTDNNMYHIGVLNVYMAKAPTTAAAFDGKGQVWFKIFQISGVATSLSRVGLYAATFPIPKNVPSGEYLLRTEYIALCVAYYFGGAQFYIGCAQIAVTGGGNGTPSPLVSIPGVYTGNDDPDQPLNVMRARGPNPSPFTGLALRPMKGTVTPSSRSAREWTRTTTVSVTAAGRTFLHRRGAGCVGFPSSYERAFNDHAAYWALVRVNAHSQKLEIEVCIASTTALHRRPSDVSWKTRCNY
ncbi:hypothetical protein EXIGLDRAFT_824366, partial [Exidia glandulosa HHB12029]